MSRNGPDNADALTCAQLNREIGRVAQQIQEESLRLEKSRPDLAIPLSDDLNATQKTLLDRFVELLRVRARKGCLGWT
jgi:hypothetical protein